MRLSENDLKSIYPCAGRPMCDDGLPCVYFIKCGNFTKIGISKDLKSRLKSINGHSPLECTVLGVLFVRSLDKFQICKDVEDVLHMKFIDFRHKGEWFYHSSKNFFDESWEYLSEYYENLADAGKGKKVDYDTHDLLEFLSKNESVNYEQKLFALTIDLMQKSSRRVNSDLLSKQTGKSKKYCKFMLESLVNDKILSIEYFRAGRKIFVLNLENLVG